MPPITTEALERWVTLRGSRRTQRRASKTGRERPYPTIIHDRPLEREEGFYWVVLGHTPSEIAYWERGEWWLAGDAKPWQPDAVTVVSDRLIFRPRLSTVA